MSNFMLQLSNSNAAKELPATFLGPAVSQWDFPRDINIAYNSCAPRENSTYCILLTGWLSPCVSGSAARHCKAVFATLE